MKNMKPSNNNKSVLIVSPVHDVLLIELDTLGYRYDLQLDITPEQALGIIHQYHGVITSTRLVIDAAFLEAATNLQWIGRMGSGMELIDVDYAQSRGIACFSSPEGNANAVAEQALGMLLCLQHHIYRARIEMQQDLWLREENRGLEIEGLTAGIIGYGNNGSAFAQKLALLGVKVLAYDKHKQGYGTDLIQECNDLNLVYQVADIISFHVPLQTDTFHYFDKHFLESMHKPFVLLNLSRGPVVHQETVYLGLQSGKITATALDVWEQEPVQKMQGLMQQQYREMLQMTNVLATPHIGGYTVQALYKMSYFLIEKIKKHLINLGPV
jgi:D-3-phosphoglycerate dehydrogenase